MKEFELKIDSIILCKQKDIKKIRDEAMNALWDIIYKYNKNGACISGKINNYTQNKEDVKWDYLLKN